VLQNLSISNYALIATLDIDFSSGLSIITGETGAGKSLLLGALGMIIGNRTDTSVIKKSDQKCVIEAVFNLSKLDLKPFFEEYNADFDEETIIRREVLPSGKSRAFVNDSPVNLAFLQKLGAQLIDIHSQHKTLEITQSDYQFFLLDTLAGNSNLLGQFNTNLGKYKCSQKRLRKLKLDKKTSKETHDYHTYLYNELLDANLKIGEQEELEELLEKLSNSEEIRERLGGSLAVLTADDMGVNDQLIQVKQSLGRIIGFANDYHQIYERLDSLVIELDDINTQIQDQLERVAIDPESLTSTNDRLQLIYSLQNKHQVDTIEKLLEVQAKLENELSVSQNIDSLIDQQENEVEALKLVLCQIGQQLHQKRVKTLPSFIKGIERVLVDLGMPNAKFKPILNTTETFTKHGITIFDLQFSANKGASLGELKKVASGGELSRIMLAAKVLLSKHIQLPTLIFDEIDTGVSGEVAQKIAQKLDEMGQNQQIFSITHLPQIASKGKKHYKVFKKDIKGKTQTQLEELSKSQRVEEIAEMIGGKEITNEAKAHALSLLES